MFVFHPISPLGGEFLEGIDNVSTFFPTGLQLTVVVLGAQWVFNNRRCFAFNTQAKTTSPLILEK